MELDFRLNPREFHRLENMAIKIRTHVPLELFPGIPRLEIKNRSMVAVLLQDPASHARRLGLDGALNRTQQTEHLWALIQSGKDSKDRKFHAGRPLLESCQRFAQAG